MTVFAARAMDMPRPVKRHIQTTVQEMEPSQARR